MTQVPNAWCNWPGAPLGQARMRVQPEDFYVAEQLGFAADGEGEHLLLQVRKRGANTVYVARALARALGVAVRDVSYAGLKDRHAVTDQWFSLPWPRKRPLPETLPGAQDWQVLQWARHGRKLRRGSHRANDFTLVLRDSQVDGEALQQRLQQIGELGFANYFGVQRFGRDGDNIEAFLRMPPAPRRVGRLPAQQAMYLSAARSMLFNVWLDQRLRSEAGLLPQPRDRIMLDGSHSHFAADAETLSELRARFARGDLHPAGPLWGRGAEALWTPPPPWQPLAEALDAWQLTLDYRAARVRVADLQWQWLADGVLSLSFTLPPGAYATGLLAACLTVSDAMQAPGEAAQNDNGED